MVRSRLGLFLMLCLGTTTSVVAQTFNYTGGGIANGNWSNILNWSTFAAPTSGIDTQINFNGNASGLTPNQNIATPFTLNRLSFGPTFPAGSIGGQRLNFATSSSLDAPRIEVLGGGPYSILNPVTFSSGTIINTVGNLTLAGALSGSGGFTKTGFGELHLTAFNPTYTGPTNINFGQVVVGHTNALMGSAVQVGNHNGLAFSSIINANLGSLAGTGNIDLGTTNLSVGTNNQSTSYSGVISGSSGLTKNGTGALTLSGEHTFLGSLRINNGSVILGTANTLQNVDVVVDVDNGINPNSLAAATLGSLAGTGNLDFGSTHLTIGGNAASTTYSGQLTGTGTRLFKAGPGTTTFTAIGSAIDRLDINGGQFVLDGGSLALTGRFDVNAAELLVQNGGVLQFAPTGFSDVDHSSGAFMRITGVGSMVTGHQLVIGITNGDAQVDNGGLLNNNILVIGNIGRGDLAVESGGTVVTNSAAAIGFLNNGDGVMTVTGSGSSWTVNQLGLGGNDPGNFGGVGTLIVADGGSVTANRTSLWTVGSSITVDRGTLSVRDLHNPNGDAAIVAISDPAVGNALTIGGNTGGGNFGGSIVDHINGPGSVIKSGTNTITFSGINTYSGGTGIEGGRLVIAANENLGAASGGVSFNGGTLELTGGFSNSRAITLDGPGTIQTAASNTFSGNFSGSGTLTKTGAGTLILTGNNSAMTGNIIISSGVLEAGVNDSLANATNVDIANGATFRLAVGETWGNVTGSGHFQLDAGATIGMNNQNATFSGTIAGNGSLTKTGSAVWTFGGVANYTGATIVQQGTLALQSGMALGSSSLTLQAGTSLTGSGTFQAPLSGNATSTITASGLLVLGSPSSGIGVVHNGILDVGSATVVLQDSNHANLNGSTQLNGGSLIANNGIQLGAGASLSGWGTVLAPIRGPLTSTLTATGALTLGQGTVSNGIDYDGILNVGSHRVILLDADAAVLGAQTNLAAGGVLNATSGSNLTSGRSVNASGSALIEGTFINNGIVNGPTAAGAFLTFDDDVSGAGNYTGNIEFLQGFSPGNSPALVTFAGNLALAGSTLLDLELAGLDRGTHFDAIDVDGNLLLDGTLRVTLLNGFTPNLGDQFLVMRFGSVAGSFAQYQGFDLGGGLLLSPLFDDTSLTLTVVNIPEPSTALLLLVPVGAWWMFRRPRRLRGLQAKVARG